MGRGRPGVTTKYVGDISSLPAWWFAWSQFMFAGPCDMIAPHATKYLPIAQWNEKLLLLNSFAAFPHVERLGKVRVAAHP